MDYQVWIKEEFGDTYTKVDCGDLTAAKREIDKAVRAGGEPILTVEVPYELSIETGEAGGEQPKRTKVQERFVKGLKEESKSEAVKSEAEPGEGAGAEGEGEVRPGDLGAVSELG